MGSGRKIVRGVMVLVVVVLKVPGTTVHFNDLAICGQHLTEILLNGIHLGHNKIPPIACGPIRPGGVCFCGSIESETPGASIHFENLAVLNQHLGEVLLNRMLLRHSQIPPFYIGRKARREIFISLTCKGRICVASP